VPANLGIFLPRMVRSQRPFLRQIDLLDKLRTQWGCYHHLGTHQYLPQLNLYLQHNFDNLCLRR